MQSDYYLNGAGPQDAEGARIAAGFRILAAAESGEAEESRPASHGAESWADSGYSIVELTRARAALQDIMAA